MLEGSSNTSSPASLAAATNSRTAPSCHRIRRREPLWQRKAWSPKTSTRGNFDDPYILAEVSPQERHVRQLLPDLVYIGRRRRLFMTILNCSFEKWWLGRSGPRQESWGHHSEKGGRPCGADEPGRQCRQWPRRQEHVPLLRGCWQARAKGDAGACPGRDGDTGV